MNPKKKDPKPKLEEKLKKPTEIKEPDKRIRRTDEEIKKEKEKALLVEQPNPLFIPILKIPFDAWAETIKVEEMRLSEGETKSLALPITQLVEYYLPKMPAIAYAWCGLILSLYAIMQPRLKIINVLRGAKSVKPAAKENPEGSQAPVKATS